METENSGFGLSFSYVRIKKGMRVLQNEPLGVIPLPFVTISLVFGVTPILMFPTSIQLKLRQPERMP
jgi:hypothetical protein